MPKEHGSGAGLPTAASKRIELKGPNPSSKALSRSSLSTGGAEVFAFMFG